MHDRYVDHIFVFYTSCFQSMVCVPLGDLQRGSNGVPSAQASLTLWWNIKNKIHVSLGQESDPNDFINT